MTRRHKTLTILLLIISISACHVKIDSLPKLASDLPIDPDLGRQLSDKLAADIVYDRRIAIRSKMEEAFRKSIDEASFDHLLNTMIKEYGKPLEFEFKQQEFGFKTYTDGTTAHMMKIWYAAKTTRYTSGSHFLIVEVVRSNDVLAISSFGIVVFPAGVPPSLT